jgi:hypothetical protein
MIPGFADRSGGGSRLPPVGLACRQRRRSGPSISHEYHRHIRRWVISLIAIQPASRSRSTEEAGPKPADRLRRQRHQHPEERRSGAHERLGHYRGEGPPGAHGAQSRHRCGGADRRQQEGGVPCFQGTESGDVRLLVDAGLHRSREATPGGDYRTSDHRASRDGRSTCPRLCWPALSPREQVTARTAI